MAEASSESSSSTDLQLLAAIKSEGALNSQLACIVARLDERTLQLCYILALQIRALQTSMDEIEKDLKKSGILKKVKKIQDTKRELAKILKSVKEDMKKAEESRKKYLPYVG